VRLLDQEAVVLDRLFGARGRAGEGQHDGDRADEGRADEERGHDQKGRKSASAGRAAWAFVRRGARGPDAIAAGGPQPERAGRAEASARPMAPTAAASPATRKKATSCSRPSAWADISSAVEASSSAADAFRCVTWSTRPIAVFTWATPED